MKESEYSDQLIELLKKANEKEDDYHQYKFSIDKSWFDKKKRNQKNRAKMRRRK